jgi:hypothetical protein
VTDEVHYPVIDVVADGAYRIKAVGVVVEQDPAGGVGTCATKAD